MGQILRKKIRPGVSFHLGYSLFRNLFEKLGQQRGAIPRMRRDQEVIGSVYDC